jgi:PAS domain S-box-containing protein
MWSQCPEPFRRAAVAGLIFGLLVTWLAASNAHRISTNFATEELAGRADAVKEAVENRIGAYEAMLRAGEGVALSSWPIRQQVWRTFVANLRLASVYPGIQGVGVSLLLRNAKDAAVIDTLLAPGVHDRFSLWPESSAAERSAIVLLEPLDARNLRALGFDMMSEPTRRSAMELARDQGVPSLSGKVRLVQETEADVQPGFLLYLPLYEPGMSLTTVQARRQALRGYIYSPFRAHDFMRSTLGTVPADTLIEVFDGTASSAGSLLFRSTQAIPDRRAPQVIRRVSLAGASWTIHMTSLPGAQADGTNVPIVISICGIAISLLFAGMLISMGVSEHRLSLETQAVHALQDSELRSSLILQNSFDAFISIDSRGRILHWNNQAEVMFGWSRAEALGANALDLVVPAPVRAEREQQLQQLGSLEGTSLLNRPLVSTCLRRNGNEVPVELSIVKISLREGPIFGISLHDITQRLQQETALRALNEQLEARVLERTAALEAANRQLESFSYSVSHDLRAPVRAMLGYLDLLLEEGDELSACRRQYTVSAKRAALRMRELIDGLLRFAGASRGQSLEAEPIDLDELVAEVVREMNVEHLVQVSALGSVMGDLSLIRQVWVNLISNAVKFSSKSESPHVSIAGRQQGQERVFSVKDNGVGFDMAYQGKLFGVFERLHTVSEFEGSGIGLAIVKTIIEQHRGRIWAEAVPLQGATFFFSLPTPDC